MIIDNDTTTWQVAELMGPEADELDGRIMLSLLARECECDTAAISEDTWMELLNESQSIRRNEYSA